MGRGSRKAFIAAAAGALALLAVALLPATNAGALCIRANHATEPCHIIKSPPPPKYLILNIAINGEFAYEGDSSEPAPCSNGAGEDSAPHTASDNFHVKLDEVFYHIKVPVAPLKGRREPETYPSKKVTKFEGEYHFKGSEPEEQCEPITWPANAVEPFCTGTLTNTSKEVGADLVNPPDLPAPKPREEIVMRIEPFVLEGLNVAPEGCNDSQGNFHKWESSGQEGQAPELLFDINVGNSPKGLAWKTYSHGEVPFRLKEQPGFEEDCSEEEKTCHQKWTGSADVNVYRVGTIDE